MGDCLTRSVCNALSRRGPAWGREKVGADPTYSLSRRENHMNDDLPDDAGEVEELPRISTGSAGLDDILGGGLDANRLYLYEGRPGTGKTTIALQFLLEGARRGERVLYITLS